MYVNDINKVTTMEMKVLMYDKIFFHTLLYLA